MFSRDRDKNKKSLVYHHHVLKIPAPETPRWSQEQAPAPDDSSCLTVAGRWQTHQNGDSFLERVDKYCQQIFGRCLEAIHVFYTFFCFFGRTFLLNLYIDCFFLSTTTMRAILYLNRISGGIPNCEVASHAASHGTRNPRLEPLKLISNTCHGTFRTKPWNPPKPFATNSPKLSKNKAKPTFQICHEETSVFPPLEPLYPKPSKLQKFPFYSPQPGSLTTTSPPFRFFSRIPAWTLTTKLKKAQRSSPNIKLVCIDPREWSVRAIVWP